MKALCGTIKPLEIGPHSNLRSWDIIWIARVLEMYIYLIYIKLSKNVNYISVTRVSILWKIIKFSSSNLIIAFTKKVIFRIKMHEIIWII